MTSAPEYDLVLETDGSTKRSNPGPSSWGFVALGPYNNIIYEDCGLIPQPCTSNHAEYWACLHALQFARDLGYVRRIELRSDSLTMVKQLRGQYGFRSDDLTELAGGVSEMIDTFERVDLIWIPRRWNGHANALAAAAFAHSRTAALRAIIRSNYETMPPEHRDLEEGFDA